jgi:hypothetical protein
MSSKQSKASKDAMFRKRSKKTEAKVAKDLTGIHPYRRLRKHTARINALSRLTGGK